jgi:diguanylate cyclase (GGDEF)-like protein
MEKKVIQLKDLNLLSQSNAIRHQKHCADLWHVQSSIDISDTINATYELIEKSIPLMGLEFKNMNLDLNIILGQPDKELLSYTLISDKELLGEMSFYLSKSLTKKQSEYLENILSLLYFPIQNALKYHSAVKASITDSLTGCGNRLRFDVIYNQLVQGCQRYGDDISVLLIDLDHFKQVNDKYGHMVGDLVLKHVGQNLMNTIRGVDKVFRYGGEEFAVLLPSTHIFGAVCIAERLVDEIHALKVQINKRQKIQPSASIGVTSFRSRDTAESLLKRADKHLYKAKDNGRNQAYYGKLPTVQEEISRGALSHLELVKN